MITTVSGWLSILLLILVSRLMTVVRDDISGNSVAGAGGFSRLSGTSWFVGRWVTWTFMSLCLLILRDVAFSIPVWPSPDGSMLNFWAFFLHCRLILQFMLVVIISM